MNTAWSYQLLVTVHYHLVQPLSTVECVRYTMKSGGTNNEIQSWTTGARVDGQCHSFALFECMMVTWHQLMWQSQEPNNTHSPKHPFTDINLMGTHPPPPPPLTTWLAIRASSLWNACQWSHRDISCNDHKHPQLCTQLYRQHCSEKAFLKMSSDHIKAFHT